MQTYLAALTLLLSLQFSTSPSPLTLTPAVFVTSDTTRYISYRLYINNPDDSTAIITGIHISCGCVMATVQNNTANAVHPGEIYVAIDTKKLDSLQPVTIDIMTIPPQQSPLRAYVYKYTP
jgi:hypothetical protein